MCLRRAPEKYIAGAALDRAALDHTVNARSGGKEGCQTGEEGTNREFLLHTQYAGTAYEARSRL
jgi:hypothetical protein